MQQTARHELILVPWTISSTPCSAASAQRPSNWCMPHDIKSAFETINWRSPSIGRVWVGYYGTLKSLITVKSVDFDGRDTDRILWPGSVWCVQFENASGGMRVCERSIGLCLSIVQLS